MYVIVMTPDSPSVSAALKLTNIIKKLSKKDQKIRYILNRVNNRPYELRKNEIEKILGNEIFRFVGPKQIILEPTKVSKVLIPFELVKKDEKTGYYLVDLKIIGENETRIQRTLINLMKKVQKPIDVKRSVIWNKEENITSIYLEVKNNFDKKIDFLELYEKVPFEFFDSIEPNFFPSNSRIEKEKKEIWFGLKNLFPNETQVIEYRIKKLVDNPALSSEFKSPQIRIYKGTKSTYRSTQEIYLEDINIPTLYPGEKKIFRFNVLNNDNIEKEIKIEFIAPSKWFSSNENFNFVLQPREMQRIEIMVGTPENITAGKYKGIILLKYDNENEQREVSFEVKSLQEYNIFVPISEPIEISFLELKKVILDNKEKIFFVGIIVFGIGGYYLIKRRKLEEKIRMESVEHLNKIKEILTRRDK